MNHLVFHPLLVLGLLLISGYVAGRAANALRLPWVTGYIVAGMIMSPSITGILSRSQVETHLEFVSDMALSLIAYAIGGSLCMSRVKMLGKPILWISLTEGVGALVFTSLAVYVASYFSPALRANGPEVFICIILIMGTVSVGTAPAATLAVVHELRARGALTTTLLGVVALDDALSIILFSWAITVAGYLLDAGAGTNLGLFHGILEIAGALTIGTIGGLSLTYLAGSRQRAGIHLLVIFGIVFLVSGIAIRFSFSPLLANIMTGFVMTNTMKHADHILQQLETVEESIYCLFFALAGAHLDIGVLTTSTLLGIILLLGRFAGKFAGTILGARISHAPAMVRKYLGITLLPQAGLSLGLIFLAQPFLPSEAYGVLVNAMLACVIINEFVSPPMVKWALNRVGEARSG